MKVYVLTTGEYSAYHIIGVTLDKGQAEHYAKVFNNSNEWNFEIVNIETYETEDLPKFVTDDPIWYCYEDDEGCIAIYNADTYDDISCMGKIFNRTIGRLECYLQAETKEKVKKIFIDKLTQYKAELKELF